MRTSLYSVLCICVRLAAVFLAIKTILAFPSTYAAWKHGDWNDGSATPVLVSYAMMLLFALFLWVFPGVLARLAAGHASAQVFESPIDSEDLQRLAISVLGLWFFFQALFQLTDSGMRELFTWFVAQKYPGMELAEEHAHTIARVAANLMQMGFGAALTLGARGLVGMLRSARHAGFSGGTPEESTIAGERP